MSKSKTTMRKWLTLASIEQTEALAQAAKTSVPHLRHIAAGRRGATAELAQRLAAASYTLKVTALRLDQRDLCEACGVCPFAVGEPMPAPATMLKPKVRKAAKTAEPA